MKKEVAIIQIPPLNKPQHNIKVAVLNKKLENIPSDPMIHVIKTVDKMKSLPKRATLQNDGVHLEDPGASLMAEAINSQIWTTTPPLTEISKPSETLVIIQAPSHLAKHVIGKGSNKHRDLQEKHKITMYTQNEEDNCKITLRGPKENVEKAQKEINTILKKAEKDYQRKTTPLKQRITCRYYLQGNCRFGDECMYSFPPGSH